MSLVIPFFNEDSVIPLFREQLAGVTARIAGRVEIIAVDDGSEDDTFKLLQSWAAEDSRVSVLRLARNFGHQAALTAGLDAARGDAIVTMDADLQDPPEVIESMLNAHAQGFDVVYAQRVGREKESIFKRFSAWAFYRLMRASTPHNMPIDVGDFRLVSRRCLDALRSMRETHRFLRGMVAWVGFPQTTVTFVRPGRAAGKTKYGFRKMLRLAGDGAVSFSPMPLRMVLLAGAVLATIGLADGIYAVLRFLIVRDTVPGWTSIMAALAFIGGGILMAIGIVGEYVGRIFEQVKGRPLYIVATTIGAQRPPDSNLARATELNRQARELLAYAATMDSAPVEALPMPLHEEESRGE